MVELSRPSALNRSKPPRGGPLLNTPWLWAYWPVSTEAREGQHSGVGAKELAILRPRSVIRDLSLGMYSSDCASRSSAMTSTMLGGGGVGVGEGIGATGDPPPPQAPSSTGVRRAMARTIRRNGCD